MLIFASSLFHREQYNLFIEAYHPLEYCSRGSHEPVSRILYQGKEERKSYLSDIYRNFTC